MGAGDQRHTRRGLQKRSDRAKEGRQRKGILSRKLKPTGEAPRNLYRPCKNQERAGAGPGHLPSIVVGSGPARRESLVSLPNAVPLTLGSGGTRKPLRRMQGPAGRSQTDRHAGK